MLAGDRSAKKQGFRASSGLGDGQAQEHDVGFKGGRDAR